MPSVTATRPLTLLNIGLSSSAAPLARLVSASYDAETENVAVNFIAGNEETLFDDLDAGHLDAILVHFLPQAHNLWFNPVALDGLVIVLHAGNPVHALSREEVQAIYSGQITDWADLGGGEGPIRPVAREPGSGPRTLFNQRIMGAQRIGINTRIAPDDPALLAEVGSTPGAIGYTMMGAVTDGRAPDVRPAVIDGVAPTPNSVGTQNYPLTAPLYFVAPDEPAGPSLKGSELRAFLAWLQSESAQTRIGEFYGRVR